MRWGTAKEYAWLHNVSLTQQYRNQLLFWLQWENPELYKLVLKEIAREPKTKGVPHGAGKAGQTGRLEP